MRREEINDFVLTNVVHGLREHNLDLVDFLSVHKNNLLSQNYYDPLMIPSLDN